MQLESGLADRKTLPSSPCRHTASTFLRDMSRKQYVHMLVNMCAHLQKWPKVLPLPMPVPWTMALQPLPSRRRIWAALVTCFSEWDRRQHATCRDLRVLALGLTVLLLLEAFCHDMNKPGRACQRVGDHADRSPCHLSCLMRAGKAII